MASSPAVGPDGTIYFGSADGRAYAVGPDGQPKWRSCTGGERAGQSCQSDADCPGNPVGRCEVGAATGGAVTAGPAIDAAGDVFIASGDGTLYAFAAADGARARAPITIGGFLASSPAVATDTANLGVVYVGSLAGGLFAICPNDISRWSAAVGPVRSTAALGSDGTVYVTGTRESRAAYAVRPDTGRILWAFAVPEAIHASAVVGDDGTVYVVDSGGNAFAIDPASGLPRAGFAPANTGGPVSASAAMGASGRLYVGTEGGSLVAIDALTGALVWQVSGYCAGGGFPQPGCRSDAECAAGVSCVALGSVHSSPAATADGGIVFGSDEGNVYAFVDEGTRAVLLWRYETGGAVRSSPAVVPADGGARIYVGSDDGNLHALRIGPGV